MHKKQSLISLCYLHLTAVLPVWFREMQKPGGDNVKEENMLKEHCQAWDNFWQLEAL